MAARGEHDRIGEDDRPRAVVHVEAVRAEDAPVVDEQARDVEVVAHLDTDLERPPDESALDLAPGVVPCETGPPPAMSAEEALRQPPVALAFEPSSPANEILDRARRLAAQELDARRVGEPVPLAQCVRGVLLPAVLGIHRPERGVDPARGEDGVRVVAAALADAEHLHSELGELDGRAQARRARPDDEHARRRTVLVRPVLVRPSAHPALAIR